MLGFSVKYELGKRGEVGEIGSNLPKHRSL